MVSPVYPQRPSSFPPRPIAEISALLGPDCHICPGSPASHPLLAVRNDMDVTLVLF